MKNFILLLIFLGLFAPVSAKKIEVHEGENLFYRKDGSLKEKSYYQDGLLQGIRYQYFKDGETVKQSTEYDHGQKSGLEKYYDKNGILRDFKQH